MTKNLNVEKIKFGEEIFGPIMHEFCDRLRINLKSHEKNSLVLFEARDGLRIKYLYDLFLKNNNYPNPKNQKEIYISRLSAVEGCLYNDLDYVLEIIVYALRHLTIKDALYTILRKNYDLSPKLANSVMNSKTFKEIYFSDKPGKEIRKHFLKKYNLLGKYITKLIEKKQNIILIDTGWTGYTQAILMRRFKKNWMGLYFGKWDYRNINPKHFNKIQGISLDSNKGINNKRESIFHYHHLIEDPLEAKIPSIESYIIKNNNVIPGIKINKKMILPQKENDYFFNGIVNYFNKNKNLSSFEIYKRAEKSYKILSRKIFFPSKKDIDIMSVNQRSADFGMHTYNDAIIRDNIFKSLRKKNINILMSLWKQGQIAYEFPIISPIVLLTFYFYTKRKGKVLLS